MGSHLDADPTQAVDGLVRAIRDLTSDPNYKLVADVFSEFLYVKEQNNKLSSSHQVVLEEYRKFRNELEAQKEELIKEKQELEGLVQEKVQEIFQMQAARARLESDLEDIQKLIERERSAAAQAVENVKKEYAELQAAKALVEQEKKLGEELAAAAAAKAADAVLLGAIGGPEWGPSSPVRPEQGLLKLRKELGTFGNLRPCSFASDFLVNSSPLKPEVCRGTDFVVVRELTGGIYFGDRKEDDGSGFALDTEPYSREEIERIARLGGFLALARNPPAKVWSLDKANVLATSRLWRKVVTEVFEKEFPQLELQHQLIDSAAMIMVKNPRALNGIVITSNLFGDIISDEASVIPGSIGLLPSASLGGIPDGNGKCNGIYEPIHGSAPDISGKGIVNPIGTILSVAMMLRYSLNLPKEANAVEEAVKRAIDGGVRTRDLGGTAGTKEMGDAVVAELVKLLKK